LDDEAIVNKKQKFGFMFFSASSAAVLCALCDERFLPPHEKSPAIAESAEKGRRGRKETLSSEGWTS
jgi:hypothetical protein